MFFFMKNRAKSTILKTWEVFKMCRYRIKHKIKVTFDKRSVPLRKDYEFKTNRQFFG